MRKIQKGLLIGLSCSLLVLGLGACKEGDSGSNYTYDWTYVKEFVDECDSDMKIDGVLDEERWQNLNWLYHGEDNVKLSYTTAFTEKGMYIAAKAEDNKMQWNARFNFSHFRGPSGLTGGSTLNSAFWFQIAGPDVVDGHAMRQFNFFVDAFDRASRNQTRFNAETTTNGDILKGEATEMVTEMFVSWDALNIELGEDGELPEFVYFTPCYRYVVENNASSVENRWIAPTGTYPKNLMYWNYDKGYAGTLADFNWYRAKTGVHFNEYGYVNYDAEGAKLGMSANGICKSDGWDVSKLVTDGQVSCVAPYEQYIFVKDVYAEKFYLKTDLVFDPYSDGNPGNEWPSMGLAVVQSGTNSRCFYISGDTVLDNKMTNGAWQTFCNSIEFQNWTKSNFGSVAAPIGKDVPTEGFELELIKDGSIIYYFVEGQLVGTDNIPELSGKACPALFSIGGRGTYKNIEVETDSDTIDAILNRVVRTVSTQVTGSGTVELEDYALKMLNGVADQDIKATILTDTNYTIGNVVFEGLDDQITDSWAFFLEHYENGVLIIPKEYIDANVVINVTFTRLRSVLSESDVVELSGTLKSEDGTALVGSNLVIYDENCQPLYYSIITSSTGKYSLLLPKAGRYTFEGHEFEVSGAYKARILGTGGYKSMTFDIDLNQVTGTKLEQDFELELLEFRPTTIASDRYSSEVQYTIDGAYKVKGAYYFEGKSVAQNEDFVLYATIDQTISSGIATELGFIVGTGDNSNGHYLIFALKKVNNGFTAFIWSEGNKEHKVTYASSTISFGGENKWMNVCPYGTDNKRPLEMALVYKNGEYTLYLNGCLAYTVAEADLMDEGYPQDTYQNIIGVEGDKKLGLVSLNKNTAFTDWGFSTDSATIQGYIDAEDRPVEVPEIDVQPTLSMMKPNLSDWLYGGNATAGIGADENLTLKGAYAFGGNGILNGTQFVVSGTFTLTNATEIGFVVTSDKNQSLKPMFVYKASNNTFMFYTGDWEKDVEGIENKAKAYAVGDVVTMTLVYKDGMYYIFLGEELACTISQTAKATYSQTILKDVIGAEKMLYLGLASLNGDPTVYTDWWYDTDENVIDGYLEGVDIPENPNKPEQSEADDWTPVFKNDGAYCEEGTNQVEIKNGGYLIEGAEVANWASDVSNSGNWPNGGPGQNEAFEVSTTVAANATATQIGFILTADGASRLQIVYNVETGRVRVTDGTLHREYNATAGLYKAGENNTFTIKYDGSVWIEFLINGTSAITNGWDNKYIHLRYGFDGDNSSNVGAVKAWQSFGTGDTLKVGLAATNGSATFTDWNFSTGDDV